MSDLSHREVADELGLQPERTVGNRKHYYCPVHDSNTADLAIYGSEDFYCYSGAKGGESVVTLVMHCRDCSLEEAQEWLSEKFPNSFSERSQEEIDRSKAAREVLQKATQLAQHTLETERSDLREEIMANRNFPSDLVEDVAIGFLSQDDVSVLTQRYDRQALIDSGLFGETDDGDLYCHLTRRIVFPYRRNNMTWFMIGRKLPDSDSPHKYKKTRVTDYNKHIPYQFSGNTEDTVIITEGITDAISAYHAGYDIVSPVTVQFRDKDVQKVIDGVQQYDNIYIAMDMDERGQEGAKKTAQQLCRAGLEPYLVELEPGTDLDDWTTENDYDISELLDSAKRYIEVLGDRAQEADERGDRKRKSEYVKEALSLIKEWDPLEKDYAMKLLPGSKQVLRKQLKDLPDSPTSNNEASEADEANEAILEGSLDEGRGGADDDLIDTFIEEEQAETFRLSGTLEDGSYIQTIYLQRGGSEQPYALVYNSSKPDLKQVHHKLSEYDSETIKEMSDDQREALDYHYIKKDGREIRYEHQPFKVASSVSSNSNRILEYAFRDKEIDDNLLQRIEEKIEEYWDHYNEDWYTVLAAWVAHTYFLQDLSITPYIFLNGKADTGKSVCQRTLHNMAYNSYMMEDATVASTQRAIHYSQATVHLDEMDKIGDEEAQDLQKSANSGYQRGSKRTLVDTNKQNLKDQLQELFTYSAKTFAANGLHMYDQHILTRAFIINSSKTRRSVKDIRDLSKEEKQEFADIRDQLFVLSLKEREEILEAIEEAKHHLELSNRTLDKVSVIYGVVRYFKGEERASEVEEFLVSQNELEGRDMSESDYAVLEAVVDRVGSDGLAVLVKELAAQANEELGYDPDSEFSLSSRGVVRRLKEYSMIRSDDSKKRTSSGVKVQIPVEHIVDSLRRHELDELVREIPDEIRDQVDDDGGGGSPPPSDDDNTSGSASFASSASLASSDSDKDLNKTDGGDATSESQLHGKPGPEEIKSAIKTIKKATGNDHATLTSVCDYFDVPDETVEEVVADLKSKGVLYEKGGQERLDVL